MSKLQKTELVSSLLYHCQLPKMFTDGLCGGACIAGWPPRWFLGNLTLRLPPIINMAQQEVNYCLNHDEARISCRIRIY